MNNRIKELAIEAGYNPLWDTKADREEYFDKEKFAELIVRECLKLCKEVEEDLELVPNKLEREASVAGVMFCYDAIRGEFGVEE